MVKYAIVCKVCGKVVEGDLLEHIKSHDPTNYFDIVFGIDWEEKVKKE